MQKSRTKFPTSLRYKYYILASTLPNQFKIDSNQNSKQQIYTAPISKQRSSQLYNSELGISDVKDERSQSNNQTLMEDVGVWIKNINKQEQYIAVKMQKKHKEIQKLEQKKQQKQINLASLCDRKQQAQPSYQNKYNQKTLKNGQKIVINKRSRYRKQSSDSSSLGKQERRIRLQKGNISRGKIKPNRNTNLQKSNSVDSKSSVSKSQNQQINMSLNQSGHKMIAQEQKKQLPKKSQNQKMIRNNASNSSDQQIQQRNNKKRPSNKLPNSNNGAANLSKQQINLNNNIQQLSKLNYQNDC